MKEDFQVPFDINESPSTLINICSGKEASIETEEFFKVYLTNGFERAKEFFETPDFRKPLKRQNLSTFGSMSQISLSNKNIKIDSEILFRRLLSVAQTREDDMKFILKHELNIYPLALFSDQGGMRKRKKKSNLQTVMLKNVKIETNLLND